MVTTDDMILIANGDSWTFGCEIVDPAVIQEYPKFGHLTEIDHLQENDSYRLSRIWPTMLAKLLNANVINLSEPGDDNSSILARTQEYVLFLLNSGIDPKNLFIVIGWTSPERRNFWYKSSDNKHSYKVKLNPHTMEHEQKPISELTKTYALNFWNPEEYIIRYVTTILNFQNFCVSNGIKFLSFNSFYRQKHVGIDQWVDINIEEQINSLNTGNLYFITDDSSRITHKINYNTIWNNVDGVKYYNKSKISNSFKSYIDETYGETGYTGWHPNEYSHKSWANELYKYIQKHNILNI